jgi:hypothetical protein
MEMSLVTTAANKERDKRLQDELWSVPATNTSVHGRSHGHNEPYTNQLAIVSFREHGIMGPHEVKTKKIQMHGYQEG